MFVATTIQRFACFQPFPHTMFLLSLSPTIVLIARDFDRMFDAITVVMTIWLENDEVPVPGGRRIIIASADGRGRKEQVGGGDS